MMPKKAKIALGIVIALVVVVVALLFFSEGLVRSGIERAGKKALGVETKLKKVDLSLLGGSIALQELAIGNPDGFQSPQLFSLGKGGVAAKLGSLLGKEVVVREIELASPEITLEQKGLKTNLTTLLKQMKAKGQKTEAEPKAKKKSGKGKAFRIERIRITEPKVHVMLSGQDIPAVTLPTIELTDISNADGTPVLLGDVFQQVLEAIAKSCVTTGGDLLPTELLANMKTELASLEKIGEELIKEGEEILKGAEGAAKTAIDDAKKIGETAKKGLEKGAGAAKKAVDGLKKVLPGKKD